MKCSHGNCAYRFGGLRPADARVPSDQRIGNAIGRQVRGVDYAEHTICRWHANGFGDVTYPFVGAAERREKFIAERVAEAAAKERGREAMQRLRESYGLSAPKPQRRETRGTEKPQPAKQPSGPTAYVDGNIVPAASRPDVARA